MRIAPALDGDGADGARHARAAQQVDAVGGLGQPEAERRAHLLGHDAPGLVGVEDQPAGEPRGVEIAEADIGIGQGRLRPAEAIADGSGHGARAPGPHVKRAGPIHADDAPATRADRMNVDNWNAQWDRIVDALLA